MHKYKSILVRKIENRKTREKKQEKLRKESGITNKDFELRERTWFSYLKEFLKSVSYAVSVIFAFIGVIIVLNPESRMILLQIFHII